MSRATSEGNPKMPLPMMELTTSAARLQRPIARTRPVCSVADKPCLYHSGGAVSYQAAIESAGKFLA